MKGLSLEAARAHAARHGYDPRETILGGRAEKAPAQPASNEAAKMNKALPKPVKMTRPEREYGLILEAMKRRGEIVDYRFQGMSLAWGKDPETGIVMRYKCDWSVIDAVEKVIMGSKAGLRAIPSMSDFKGGTFLRAAVRLIEVKGAHVWERDLVRFKGCRSEWPMFQFEMHQLKAGVWSRIL